MAKILKVSRDLIILYLFFALISALPSVRFGNLSNSIDYFLSNLQMYTYNLLHGSFGTYLKGVDERGLLQDMLPFAWRSFRMLFISLLVATLISIMFGIFLSAYRKKDRFINGFLGILNSIPDFIFVLLLQLIAVTINLKIGKSIFRITSFGEYDAILLPLISLIIIPMVYFTKEIMDHITYISTEEYIRTALSKGLSKWNVISQHVLTNLIPYLKADLIKVISISIGNLFIIEYLYSLKGITSFMFSYQQFQVWMTGFLFLSLIFIVIYLLLQLLLNFIRRLVVGE